MTRMADNPRALSLRWLFRRSSPRLRLLKTPPASSTSDGATAAPLPTLAQTSTETDRDALVALYNATNGPRWSNNEGWLSDAPISKWAGVGVFADKNLRVISLILTDKRLSGEIPPELGNLSNLTRLHLDENELSGEIPSEFGRANLTNLWLYRNQLSGEIPSELGNLANLQWLRLYRNQLSGEIPSEFSNLSDLEVLELWGNQLSGEIPSELGSLLQPGKADPQPEPTERRDPAGVEQPLQAGQSLASLVMN